MPVCHNISQCRNCALQCVLMLGLWVQACPSTEDGHPTTSQCLAAHLSTSHFWGRGSQHIPVRVLCTLARPSAKPMGPSAKPVGLSAFQTLPTLPGGNVDSEALELGCWEPGVPLLHAGCAPWDHQSRSAADAAGPVPRRAALPPALPSHPLPFLCADTLGMAFGCFL